MFQHAIRQCHRLAASHPARTCNHNDAGA